MFDAPLDGMVLWAGLSLVGLAVAGVALSLPAAAPPDAGAVAAAIDEVATSPHQATTTVRLSADAFELRPGRVSLRHEGVTARASLVSGSALPAGDGSLRAVLAGRSPGTVYDRKQSFRQAIAGARDRLGKWRPAPARVRVRRVTWGEIDVTLVG